MAKAFWHIGNCSLFQQLSATQLACLESKARSRVFPKGAAIYLPTDQADCVFLLAEGRIRLCSITPDGKQAILGFIEPGEVFGELALFHSNSHEERAESATTSTVVLLPGEVVRQFMENCPQLAIGITKLIGFRRARIERRLRSLLFRSNRDRLIQLLLELADQYGKKHALGILIGISLTHQELASIIGATRESVTMTLGDLQSEGLIQVARQKLVIMEIARLAGIVQMQVPSVGEVSRSESNSILFRAGNPDHQKQKENLHDSVGL
jgi:CRP/FNR family transcriptional regulator, cyclic AMP receptor protein